MYKVFDTTVDTYNLALDYIEQTRYNKAINLLNEALGFIQKESGNAFFEIELIAQIQNRMGETYQALNQFDKAIFFFIKSITNINLILENNFNPENKKEYFSDLALTYIDMASIYRVVETEYTNSINSFKKAIEYHDILIALEPENLHYLNDKAVILCNIAETYTLYEQNRDSLIYIHRGKKLCNQILELNPLQTSTISTLGNLNLFKAQVFHQMNQRDRAIKSVGRAMDNYNLSLDINPKSIDTINDRGSAYLLLAMIYDEEHDKQSLVLEVLNKAILGYNEVLSVDSKDILSLYNIANAKSHIGRVYQGFGELNLALKFWNMAIEDYHKILELNPYELDIISSLATTKNSISDVYSVLHDKDSVMKLLDDILKLFDSILIKNPNHEEALYQKSIVQLDKGRLFINFNKTEEALILFKEVIEDSNRVIDEYPNDTHSINKKAMAISAIAEIYYIQGKTTEAKVSYTKAIEEFNLSINIENSNSFSLNNRAILWKDMFDLYVKLEDEEKASISFDNSLADYNRVLDISPNNTDTTINRATLMSDWVSFKKDISDQKGLETLYEIIQSYDSVLTHNPYNSSASINRLNALSKIALIYKKTDNIDQAIETSFKEVEGYNKLLNIYSNDLLILMNTGVSKLYLAEYLIEGKREDEALLFLEEAICNYDLALKKNNEDIDTLLNKSITLGHIIKFRKEQPILEEYIATNQHMLSLYDRYFYKIVYEDDSFSMTEQMLFPLSSIVYAYYLSERIDKRILLNILETTKSKTLKYIMSISIEKERDVFVDENQKKEFQIIKAKLDFIKEEIRQVTIVVKEQKEFSSQNSGLKSIPREIEKRLEDGLAKRDRLYEEFNRYSKELFSILNIKEFDGQNMEREILDKIDEESVVLYPIHFNDYHNKQSELSVVALYKRDGELSVDIIHKTIDSLDFIDYIYLIRDVEEMFFLMKSNKTIEHKIEELNNKEIGVDNEILQEIFELDSNKKIVSLKMSGHDFAYSYKYEIIQNALSFIADICIQSIPKGTKKIYFSPFGDLNLLPLHAISTGEDAYLIEKYEIAYLPFLSILNNTSHLQKQSNKNLFISVDSKSVEEESNLHIEAITSCEILKGEYLPNIDTTEFKKSVHNQSYNLLHLSTHGLSDLNNPLNSHLLFKNSKLSLLEIYGLKLDINLVVLSACETNLSTLKGADEVLAFERAFLIAGAKNIITTFSTVDVIRSQDFIELFYKKINRRTSISKAFQEACLKDIEENGSMEWSLFRFTGE